MLKLRVLPALVACAAGLGCGDGLVDPTAGPVDIVAPGEVVLVPGGHRLAGPGVSYGLRVYVQLLGEEFAGEVILTVDAPHPFAPVPSQTVTVAGTTAASFLLMVPADAAPATRTIRVTADAGGAAVSRANIRAVISPVEAFFARDSIAVARGASNTARLQVVRAEGTAVTVEVGGAGGGVSATAVQEATGIFIDLVATPAATLGTQTLRIRATAAGVTRETALKVGVVAPSSKRLVAFRVCGRPGTSDGFSYAYANEGEAWTSIAPGTDAMIRFNATPRVRIARRYTYRSFYGGSTHVNVMNVTADDLDEMQCPSAHPGPETYPVVVANATGWNLSLGAFNTSSSGSIQGEGAHPGAADLLGAGSTVIGAETQRRGIIVRDVDLGHRDTLRADFAGPQSIALVAAPFTASEPVLFSAQGFATATTGIPFHRIGAVPGMLYGLPVSALAEDDIHVLTVSAAGKGSSHWYRSVEPRHVELGPDVLPSRVDLLSGAVRVPFQSEYPDLAGVGYTHTIDGRGIYYSFDVRQSAGYGPAVDGEWLIRIPDLGRFAQLPSLGPSVIATVGAGRPALLLGANGRDGETTRWASHASVSTP